MSADVAEFMIKAVQVFAQQARHLQAKLAVLEFLREHAEYCVQVVRLLSEDLHGLYHKFRSITAHPGRPRHRPVDEQLN